jgi:pyrimidine operon attenuation protein/uracil phosphoribosyltransferase
MANIYCKYDDYYGDNLARLLAHKMKRNDRMAIQQIANDLSSLVNGDCGLIPIPGRFGIALNTALLVDFISEKSRYQVDVVDVMVGSRRQALYKCKIEGKEMDESTLGFKLSGEIPEDKKIYLVDNVVATGLTASAALKLVPSADILVHSIDEKTFEQSKYRKDLGKIISPSHEELLPHLHRKNGKSIK